MNAHSKKTLVIETQSACVDWLTVVAREGGMKTDIFISAQLFLSDLKDAGFTARPWGMKGYKGWSCGSVRWGTRETDDILMLSGEYAQVNGLAILQQCPNPSRIDLALTITLATPVREIAWDAYQKNASTLGTPCNKRRKLTFIRNNWGGQTVYIGSRFSDQYGRLYDKGRESSQGQQEGTPEGKIWRYEVEFKGKRAKRIGDQLLASIEQNDNIAGQIGATVDKWFLSRDVEPINNPYVDLPYFTEVSATVSDDDKTIAWISSSVSPSVQRLIDKGKKDAVLDALGLGDLTIFEKDDKLGPAPA